MADISAMPMAMMANGKAKMAECVAASSDSTPALPSRSGCASAGSLAMSAGVTTKATVTEAGDEAGDDEAEKDAQQRDHRPTRSGYAAAKLTGPELPPSTKNARSA